MKRKNESLIIPKKLHRMHQLACILKYVCEVWLHERQKSGFNFAGYKVIYSVVVMHEHWIRRVNIRTERKEMFNHVDRCGLIEFDTEQLSMTIHRIIAINAVEKKHVIMMNDWENWRRRINRINRKSKLIIFWCQRKGWRTERPRNETISAAIDCSLLFLPSIGSNMGCKWR